jgi:iron complex transport system permease protein
MTEASRAPIIWTFLPLMAALVVIVVIATGMGFVQIPFLDVIRIVVHRISGIGTLIVNLDDLAPVVVMDVRLPRILTSVLVGGGLAICGAVFQGILLNPLADPYTLGVSAGAAFGASLALLLNLPCWGSGRYRCWPSAAREPRSWW